MANTKCEQTRHLSGWSRDLWLCGVVLMLGGGCVGMEDAAARRAVSVIAFGSCIDRNEHPMLEVFLREKWDVAVMLVDNIYADTTNRLVMRAKYDSRKGSVFWRELRERGPVLATWDDHDFGWNGGGADYPMKRESQRLFLEFMDEPPKSARWRREGITTRKCSAHQGNGCRWCCWIRGTFGAPFRREFTTRCRAAVHTCRRAIQTKRCWAKRNGNGWSEHCASRRKCA